MNLFPDIEGLIDAAMLQQQREQIPRTYLGGSRWGEECSRMLAYEWHKTPTDEEDQFPAHILRVFDMGHDAEERMADYLRLAGFGLATVAGDGEQFGFTAADGKLSGHCDGLILSGPALDLPFPLVWENKGLNDKSFTDTKKKGLKASKPVYYGQLQTYMAYLDQTNGALFTAINRNDGHIYPELIPFDPRAAQDLSDGALRIVQTEAPEEMPRISEDPAFWKCKFCSFYRRCHDLPPIVPAPAGPFASFFSPN